MTEVRGRAGGDAEKSVNVPSTSWSTLRNIPRRVATPRVVTY